MSPMQTIDTSYFSIALKNMKDGFAERFEQFKTNKSTLAFVVNPLNTNEINIEPFGIDAGSLQMQLLDLKTKDLWSDKFTELKSKLEIQKCMHIAQQKWTTLKEIPLPTPVVDECLQSEDITRMDWPAYSPDLNPIEHVWDMLGRRIAARQPPPTCLPELRRTLLDEWCNIPH
ncbi:hypothetical protein AVEN_149040-1 [Araneus ventricosus]|uniref:Tc1-like transposase DDE domain-containing protein n=1 Tax=Araneus ventricosus TaxID=182803 RepID=A0A4Y2UL47_ARAVE|nr:hypothetical protein AVEN_149040-1 [Araneus ventricosus]